MHIFLFLFLRLEGKMEEICVPDDDRDVPSLARLLVGA